MKIYVCIMAMLMTATLQAQTNFNGTWSLKEKQHISGPDYSNGVPNKLNVQQTKDSVIIEYISIDGDNKESKSRVAYPMNGKSYTMVSAASGRKTVKHLEWTLDKKAVTFTNDIYKQGSEEDIDSRVLMVGSYHQMVNNYYYIASLLKRSPKAGK